MIRRLGVFLGCTLFTVLWIATAHAERRVALLIGNGAYASAPLANPRNDVDTMKVAFAGAGFDIIEAEVDLSRTAMTRALEKFEAAAKGSDIAVIFYSGHGVEVGGVNYLIPIDARLTSDRDVKFEAIPLDDVLQSLEGAAKLKLVLLDACRDNPFNQTMRRVATRGAPSRGLVRTEASSNNMLIAYAAAPGRTALDGSGRNSPFTAALAKYLVTPGTDVRLALGKIRDEVGAATQGQQQPFLTGSLGGELIPLGGRTELRPQVNTPVPDADAAARSDFALAKSIGTVAAWDAFLARYERGFFADLAVAERQRIKNSETPVKPKPNTPIPNNKKVAETPEQTMKRCGAEWQAAKEAKTMAAGETWRSFLGECRRR